MDYLSSVGLEPQLAIPVVGVVLFAVLVYIFGFQKTEEPSYEHLAVLQSTYKPKSGSGLKPKNSSGVSQASKTANASKAKEKPISNGHVVQDKEKNGSVKNGKALNGLNKENKPPQNAKNTPIAKKEKKVAAVKPADFEEGDWIQAVSRKDKKNRVKKDDVKLSPRKENISTPDQDESWESEAVKEVESSLVQNQTTQTTPLQSPEKKAKSTKGTTTAKESSSGSSAEPSPKKQPKPAPVEKSTPIPAKVEEEEVVEVKSAAKENVKSESPKKSAEEPVVTDDPKSNVAFDEMAGTAADIWEEAKSRGTKKRRTRRD